MVEFPGLMKGTVVVHCTQQVERTLQVPLPRSVQHSHHSIPLLLHLHKMSGLFGKFLLISYFLFLLELKVNYSPIHFFTYFKLPQTPRTDLFEAQLYLSRRNLILNKHCRFSTICSDGLLHQEVICHNVESVLPPYDKPSYIHAYCHGLIRFECKNQAGIKKNR